MYLNQYTIVVVLLCCVGIGIYYVYCKFLSRMAIDEHKQRSIELYLDRVFITKMVDRLTCAHPFEMCCHDIVEYFCLDNLLLFNKDGKEVHSDSNISQIHIARYIKEHLDNILGGLSNKDFISIDGAVCNFSGKLNIKLLGKEGDFVVYAVSNNEGFVQTELAMLMGTVTAILNIAYILSRENGGFEKT